LALIEIPLKGRDKTERISRGLLVAEPNSLGSKMTWAAGPLRVANIRRNSWKEDGIMVTQSTQNKEKDKKDFGNDRGNSQSKIAPFRQTTMAPSAGFDPFHRFRDEFNRLFDQFAPGWVSAWDGSRPEHWGLDVQEDDTTMTVRAEAPGFEPGEFNVEVRDNQLVMCACHKAEHNEEKTGAHRWQRQEFYHSMMLPSGVDAEKVEADYRHGILSVKIPKTEAAQGHHIEVKG